MLVLPLANILTIKSDGCPDYDAEYSDMDVSYFIADLLLLQKLLGFKDAETIIQTVLVHYEGKQEDEVAESRGSSSPSLLFLLPALIFWQ